MALGFDLTKREILDKAYSLDIYRFNLAENYALLSNDSAVVRRFYQLDAGKLGATDIYKWHEVERTFFFNARVKNAFVYAGLTPWIVESIVRLVASSGFKATINIPDEENDKFIEAYKKDMDEYLKEVINEINLQDKFERGVYLESGLGDFAYRISHDKDVSDIPIVDVIEPQYIEVKYKRGKIKEITIKESTDELQIGHSRFKETVEIHENYKREDGKIYIYYKFFLKDKEITEKDENLFLECKKFWGIDKIKVELPFKDFPIIFKKNNKKSELYNQERGVPDIQGLSSIEDALSESLSNLVDTIRKSAPKTFVDEQLLATDIKGETDEYSAFDHEYLLLKNSGLDPTKLLVTIQAKIDYQAHIETARSLISHAINKAGLSPTTLGVTGLESINSAADSQDAREKPSIRTRKEKLKEWANTIAELLDKYFQYLAYMRDEKIESYKGMFNVTFNEYINPSTENVIDVISRAIVGRVYSVETGVEKNFIHEGKDYNLEDVITESARIRGKTIQEEMQFLGLLEETESEEDEDLPISENTEGDEPAVFHKQKQPTEALNEEGENGGDPNKQQ